MLLNSGFHLLKDPVILPLKYNALRPACLEQWKPEQDARQAPGYFPPHAYRKKKYAEGKVRTHDLQPDRHTPLLTEPPKLK